MIERVVENWLTSVNERQYQIPFCQLLAAEGETVVYISPHGQREQGKDVITLGRDRIACAYQLKAGRVTLKDWREFHGEVNELVTYPIDHPSISTRKQHRPFFVTNGTVADPVLSAIGAANRFWVRNGAKPIQLIARDQLVSRFVRAHGRYLPHDPVEFSLFLDLVVRGGNEPFAKGDFARFLESLIPFDVKPKPTFKNIERAASSTVLLTTYVTQGCVRQNNHWALFEAWVMAASYILAIAELYSVPPSHWSTPFELAELGAIRALEALADECQKNTTLFTQGNPLTDGAVYGPRVTILCGLLSALNLYRRIRGVAIHEYAQEFLNGYLRKLQIWGESAVPYVWLAALESEQRGQHAIAEGLMFQVLTTIAQINARKGVAVPNPYWGPEDALKLAVGFDLNNRETFDGHSYTEEPLIDFLARRLSRRALASKWEQITRGQFAEFFVKESWEWFRWRARHGFLKTTMPRMPESWSRLLAHATAAPQGLSPIVVSKPEFAVLFTLVFPHRFGCEVVKLVESSLSATLAGSKTEPTPSNILCAHSLGECARKRQKRTQKTNL